MKIAPIHPQEAERLAILKGLRILDSAPEFEFDELVHLAAQICETPMAALSLIDEKRQWFKAKFGVEVNETPREVAFCSHTILGNDVLIVKDSKFDPRFADHPASQGKDHGIFYAGVPISISGSAPVGTLCVVDNVPRELRADQIEALKSLSAHVARLMGIRAQVLDLHADSHHLIFQKVAFENMSDGVVIQDRTGRIVDFNPAAIELLGLSSDQLLGKTSFDPDWRAIKENGADFPGSEHPAMVAIRTGAPQRSVIMGIQTSQPEVRWIQIHSTPLFLDGSKSPSHALTNFTDISEMRSAQRVIVQSAKMSALGEMAAGVAHEINTPLSIIQSSAEELQFALSEESPNQIEISKHFDRIKRTVGRISNIVKGLRKFSRTGDNDPIELTSLETVISDTLELCSERARLRGIDLRLSLSERGEIWCQSTGLAQVLLNLLNNAFDAVFEAPSKWVQIKTLKKDDWIVLEVVDSGPGVDPRVKEKLGQPFFTTKGPGAGTGLGLSISKGIVESMGGSLTLAEGEPHTTFRVALRSSKAGHRSAA